MFIAFINNSRKEKLDSREFSLEVKQSFVEMDS